MPHSKRIADNKIEGQRAGTIVARSVERHDHVSEQTARTKRHVTITRQFLERLHERIADRRREAG